MTIHHLYLPNALGIRQGILWTNVFIKHFTSLPTLTIMMWMTTESPANPNKDVKRHWWPQCWQFNLNKSLTLLALSLSFHAQEGAQNMGLQNFCNFSMTGSVTVNQSFQQVSPKHVTQETGRLVINSELWRKKHQPEILERVFLILNIQVEEI